LTRKVYNNKFGHLTRITPLTSARGLRGAEHIPSTGPGRNSESFGLESIFIDKKLYFESSIELN